MTEKRMLIRPDSEADAKKAQDVLAQAHIPVQTETDGGETLLYVADEDAEQAEKILTEAGLIDDAEPKPAENGRKRSVVLTVLMLLLIALAVYGTDAIIELCRRLFS